MRLRARGFEPPRLAATDPKSVVSANSTTPASNMQIECRMSDTGCKGGLKNIEIFEKPPSGIDSFHNPVILRRRTRTPASFGGIPFILAASCKMPFLMAVRYRDSRLHGNGEIWDYVTGRLFMPQAENDSRSSDGLLPQRQRKCDNLPILRSFQKFRKKTSKAVSHRFEKEYNAPVGRPSTCPLPSLMGAAIIRELFIQWAFTDNFPMQ